MLHQSDLAGWYVQTAGRALAILLAGPMVGALLSAMFSTPGLMLLVSAISVFGLLVWMTTIHAPNPSDAVLALLEADGGRELPDSSQA